MKADAAMERELSRLEKLNDMQLLDVIMKIDDDPAPAWAKDLIMRKINSIMNKRIGLEG